MQHKNLYLTAIVFFFLIITTRALYLHTPDKSFVIIIPSYNNAQWCHLNLASVFAQNYKNYRVIYINDCSTDNTGNKVTQYCAQHASSCNIQIIHNDARRGALANIYNAVHSCKDNEIIVLLDGDDFLMRHDVLSFLNNIYQDPMVLITYGQFCYLSNRRLGEFGPFPADIVLHNDYRHSPIVASHVRTFYAGLFKKINKEDLLINNQFIQAPWDLAIMIPMLEMAAGRFKHISEVFYMYNDLNPINDFKVRLRMLLTNEKIIRSRKPYEPLNQSIVFG